MTTQELSNMRAYTDGACRCGNPGECSAAFAVFEKSELRFPWKSSSRYLGPELHTNNYAEYQGMLDLLKWAEKTKVQLDIFCDSKLVVEQVKGNWKVNEASLAPLQREAQALFIRGFHTLTHIRGHQGDPGNEYVDRLCNEVLDAEFERRKNVQG